MQVAPAIVIEDYCAGWPDDFRAIGSSLRSALGGFALRIDHIGSTAVPGLAAKDVIDVQITVESLDDPLLQTAVERTGAERFRIESDHLPPGADIDESDLRKQLYVLQPPARRVNIHVRQSGRFNQRYPLLCRDYLRAHPGAAAAYAAIKRQLATHFPDDVEAYYAVKDPTFDLLMVGADEWARSTAWEPPPSDA